MSPEPKPQSKRKLVILYALLIVLISIFAIREIEPHMPKFERWQTGSTSKGTPTEEELARFFGWQNIEIPRPNGGKRVVSLSPKRTRISEHCRRDRGWFARVFLTSYRLTLTTNDGVYHLEVTLRHSKFRKSNSIFIRDMTIDEITPP